jgi:hypothetical protein
MKPPVQLSYTNKNIFKKSDVFWPYRWAFEKFPESFASEVIFY